MVATQTYESWLKVKIRASLFGILLKNLSFTLPFFPSQLDRNLSSHSSRKVKVYSLEWVKQKVPELGNFEEFWRAEDSPENRIE